MKMGRKELRYAFPKTVPVMIGYLFLGAAYGILMQVNGFGLGWTAASSALIYAGSLQYLEVTLLAAMVHPLYAFFMGLMLNARHLFYGLSMLGKMKEIRHGKPYLIFGLTDETFSVLCGEETPGDLDRNAVYFWITFLDHLYWFAGSAAGCLLGSAVEFDSRGLDFALTALFVVIFTDQWKSRKDHRPALTGVAASALCVMAFGADLFLVPAMALILAALTLGYRKEAQEKKEEQAYE